ncbi:Phosphate transporter PHO1-like protein 1 [Raphanus sativus]|uniref:Phosphate transporter PHO1 homolog 1-like n=1 Tax=Raphanus sativus TaxID=3726 RepID=A0A6J0LW13_RAPSA|nr:phosphate transporter PHO1 homolog 1-like [Raphanus sativus]KAJ4884234.1 Phosphate transporter PHO1-like protein 1 [Raphanus sativus]
MVPFTKQFEGQLVPEWKDSFVDYSQLKKDLKKIHLLTNGVEKEHTETSLINTIKSSLGKLSIFGNKEPERPRAIKVHRKLASSVSNSDVYETELLETISDDTGAAKEFFMCLDTQLNKVNQFYKTKEKEFLERGECLKKQMEILIEVKDAFNQKQANGESTQESKEDDSISCTISCEEDSVKSRTEEIELQEYCLEDLKNNGAEKLESPRSQEPTKINKKDSKMKTDSGRVFSCHGRKLKIKIPLTNPSRKFSAISYFIKEDLINQSSSKKRGPDGVNKLRISKKTLNHAEKMIKGALTELYKGLNYLKTYRNLNMLAFMKILKKFEKVTGKQILPIYLKVVESSYFNSSDKVINLSDEVEELFIKHFAGENRRKAMKYLKPHHRKESHSVTFFIGLFTGCFVALLAGYIIVAHLTGMYKRHTENTFYMETAYPVLSMFGLLFLHLFLYGCNIFMWRKARINYSFIFELGTKNELKFRDVFLICTASMSVIAGVMFVHLLLLAKGYSFGQVQVIPGLLLLVFFLILFCPLNIFYKSSRYRFISVIRNIVFSPLYKVVMLDFFMADQLCSQVPMLRNLEYIACYYITGSYTTQDYGYCMRVKYYRDLAYAVSFLPYYWRAMQCARRWFDEGETSHLVNLGKYVSAMLAAGTKVAYEKERSIGWLCLVVAMSSIATVYQLYWDFVKDWGLFQHNSNNPWLRNQLMLRQKSIYYFSMVLNLVLRLAWVQTVVHSSFEHVDYRVTGLFLAALEVIRRGHWNFYRLENEHLNNAGKFRAVKTVPLPFREVDEED